MYGPYGTIQGPVVQSIVSLMKSFVENLLSLSILTKSTALLLLLYFCFTSMVNIYGHVGTVS